MSNFTQEYLEIEVKFFNQTPHLLQNKIDRMGAIGKGRVFEKNIRYENEKNTLKSQRILLRLRQDDQARLTVKLDPQTQHSEFKILTELEVMVSDFEIMDLILKALGFHQAQIYEKQRETFEYKKTTLCLDALPFGNFLEIEGAQAEIVATASDLGLNWDQRILSNYLEIFEYIKKDRGLKFKDITFENFKNIPINFELFRHRFEAQTAPQT